MQIRNWHAFASVNGMGGEGSKRKEAMGGKEVR